MVEEDGKENCVKNMMLYPTLVCSHLYQVMVHLVVRIKLQVISRFSFELSINYLPVLRISITNLSSDTFIKNRELYYKLFLLQVHLNCV